jgi:hypothetical protein
MSGRLCVKNNMVVQLFGGIFEDWLNRAEGGVYNHGESPSDTRTFFFDSIQVRTMWVHENTEPEYDRYDVVSLNNAIAGNFANTADYPDTLFILYWTDDKTRLAWLSKSVTNIPYDLNEERRTNLVFLSVPADKELRLYSQPGGTGDILTTLSTMGFGRKTFNVSHLDVYSYIGYSVAAFSTYMGDSSPPDPYCLTGSTLTNLTTNVTCDCTNNAWPDACFEANAEGSSCTSNSQCASNICWGMCHNFEDCTQLPGQPTRDDNIPGVCLPEGQNYCMSNSTCGSGFCVRRGEDAPKCEDLCGSCGVNETVIIKGTPFFGYGHDSEVTCLGNGWGSLSNWDSEFFGDPYQLFTTACLQNAVLHLWDDTGFKTNHRLSNTLYNDYLASYDMEPSEYNTINGTSWVNMNQEGWDTIGSWFIQRTDTNPQYIYNIYSNTGDLIRTDTENTIPSDGWPHHNEDAVSFPQIYFFNGNQNSDTVEWNVVEFSSQLSLMTVIGLGTPTFISVPVGYIVTASNAVQEDGFIFESFDTGTVSQVTFESGTFTNISDDDYSMYTFSIEY